MIEIDEINHVPVLISSLDKIYNKAKVNGKLDSVNLYLLNIVFKLLNGCCVTLTNDQRRKLITIYSNIYFNSQSICKVKGIVKYKIPTRTKFFQAETEDCNTYPKFDNIYYWQEEDYTTILDDIVAVGDSTGYLTGKSFYSYAEFSTGKLLEYNNIGRICFMALESNNATLTVTDILGNVVNDAFDTHYYASINATLFVSRNIFSHGPINFKIIKT